MQALELVFSFLEREGVGRKDIKKVGHRVVHGGEEFVKPTLLTVASIKSIAKYSKLAPLHNPANLDCIKSALKLLPHAKQYACFDTMFYKTLPEYVYRYALPNKFYKNYQVRKYGFHGLSHEYVADMAAKKLHKPLSKLNLITCHLGSGCSITAIRGGKAVDTSMGFTPLEGLMMSSRAGDMDPSVALYLLKQGFTPTQIDDIFNKQSGWLGVSGFKDLRDVLIVAGYKIPGYKGPKKITIDDKMCSKLALQMFIYQVQKYIGAYYAVLGKVDALVFTAGVGERNSDVRKLITKDLPFRMKVMVVPTNEELQIARSI